MADAIDMHEAINALGKWVPRLEHLVQRWGAGGSQQGIRDDLERLRVCLLATAGHQTSFATECPIPRSLVEEAAQLALGMGTIEVAGGYLLRYPGGGYALQEAPVDEPLRLRRLVERGGEGWVPFSGIREDMRAGVALRVWAGAVAALLEFEASAGDDAELLRRADWWLVKAASAWSVVKEPIWGELVEACRRETVAYWKGVVSQLGNEHEKVFAQQNLDELAGWAVAGFDPPVVLLHLGVGVSDNLIVITRAVAGMAMAAHFASASGFNIPGMDDSGTIHTRMAGYLGTQIVKRVREAQKADLVDKAFTDVTAIDVIDTLAAQDGITLLGKG